MLARQNIIPAKEAEKILAGLAQIRKEFLSERFRFLASDEDIHSAIERRLTEIVGPPGGHLHTARSRNDQIVLDVRLYLKDVIGNLRVALDEVREVLARLARQTIDLVMPGYTHQQRAQPVLLAHHLFAYYDMLGRDDERFADCRSRVDMMPLGSGALAGVPYPIDRAFVARQLGFHRISENSIDAVSDRDFIAEFLAATSILFVHLSRLCADLTLWATAEFGFVEFPDEFSTGSSIMPQKKNPDVAELVRGKSGRIFGSLVAVLTVMKGLPLAYQSDLQEDKEPMFDAADTALATLRTLAAMLPALRFDARTHARGCAGVPARNRARRFSRREGLALPRGARGRRRGGATLPENEETIGNADAHRASSLLSAVRPRSASPPHSRGGDRAPPCPRRHGTRERRAAAGEARCLTRGDSRCDD